MGSYYVNKILLLDENDAEQDYGFGFDDFDELRDHMMQYAEEELGGLWPRDCDDRLCIGTVRSGKGMDSLP